MAGSAAEHGAAAARLSRRRHDPVGLPGAALRGRGGAMTERSIYTLVRGADWRAAERIGEYRGSADDSRDGFLHFSTAAQVRASAAKHRRGEPELWLVEAEVALLGAALKFEPAAGGSRPGLFPHLYGKLPIAAVLSAVPLTLRPDGTHDFPEGIP
jgi:uncharacterized protein (DUF952 family)